MASKALLLLRLLVALLLLAAVHRTAATSGVAEQCRREVRSRDMSSCAEFLSEQDRKPYYGAEPSLSGRGSSHFYRCCDQLRSIDNYQCRCDALRLQIEKLSRGPHGGGVMYGTAKIMPRMCGIGPDTCSFQSSSWF